ncbi:polysaccharide biosynthesis protein [Streptococcus gallinaceus]|uniref:polysaccharide biosynthesis protein n=1 Tax=Streptococcus gallinaceus TaxID=165758 RepID=UPI0020A3A5C0|nr:nucleoside-diphosphate sugar epimerase/dehydratase [Streptococcus gallinaceus]MCP1770148.1 FlaA1/EpsC-like NDP-sugar epimerase [Streptococcus gallinaceus]
MENLSRRVKRFILIVIDMSMLFIAMLVTMLFVGVFAEVSWEQMLGSYVVVVIIYLVVASQCKIFSILNRFTDYRVLFRLTVSLVIAYMALSVFAGGVYKGGYSYRFLILSWLLSTFLMTSPRIIWREMNSRKKRYKLDASKVRTLVVGAGSGGSIFVQTVLETDSDIDVVGIVDADTNKHGTYLHGIKVMGNRENIPALVANYNIEQVTIAIPSISGTEREKLVEICNQCSVRVNSMPSVEDVITTKISTQNLREIDIADLLGRKEIELDQTTLGEFFRQKTVLVTGAGGSIGSEICRQISNFKPEKLLLLGHGENSIYLIHRELLQKYGKEIEIIPIIADIQDRGLIFNLMKEYRPNYVYHAAAHKHVPLMEFNPKEAVKNNIFGTKNVAEAAWEASVEKFVMISTDKAVNPPNVMGATKRVAEMIVTGLNDKGKTQFVAVRFGNVLGSRGSVVPVFKEQVAKGGPLTVTDFRMTRYFMTIPEASRLVIQAGYQAKGGEVFVLDMGEPVKIVDLAKKVIKLSGHTEEEIGIVESGIRPGEKLYEELLSSDERVNEQIHEKIFIGKVTLKSVEEVDNFIAILLDLENKTLKEKLIEFAKQE